MTDEFQSTPKEHKNIKRRVYDALNVLIAANILTKNGKIIKKNQSKNPFRLTNVC